MRRRRHLEEVGADFPKIPLEDSAKKWQNSFFYVRNPGADRINLSAFAIAPPQAKTNWGYSLHRPSQEIGNLCERVTVMRTHKGSPAPTSFPRSSLAGSFRFRGAPASSTR